VSHNLVCWNCGTSLAHLSLPLRRLDECAKCRAELHVCKMCVEYDTRVAKHCREPTAEEVQQQDAGELLRSLQAPGGRLHGSQHGGSG